MNRASLEAELEVHLRLIDSGTQWYEHAGELLCRLVGGHAVLYGWRTNELGQLDLSWMQASNVEASVALQAQRRLRSTLSYDPGAVETEQRNRVKTLPLLIRDGFISHERARIHCEMASSVFGARIVDQMRLLVCEGATAVAWVGALETDPKRPFTTTRRRALQRLAPAFIERFQLDRRLERAPLAEATLEAFLGQVDQPTWLLNGQGHVVLTNPAGELRLARKADGTRQALRGVAAGDVAGFRVAELQAPGFPKYRLVMERGEGADVARRLEHARRSWELTDGEAAVLALVARGLTNAAIARETGRAVRTIELYVSRLMTKARVDNRASLIAKVWHV